MGAGALSDIDPNWDPWGQTAPLQSVPWRAAELHVGDHVRLRPRGSADIMDMALAGKTAIVEAIEQDYDDEVQVAVVLDDDPGRDLGMLRQPGHRFFFRLEEVEPA
ncbi:MAG: hypothetical protein DLM67_06480 [Candidatus Nephthysia bennettiae]|nr:MAG: hypothetical protein DLM67_06480 [Candidatus Dormibacteraeota bacterium]